MAADRKLNVKVPGESAQSETVTDQAEQAETMTESPKDDYESRFSALEARLNKLESQPAPSRQRAFDPEKLPRASDIDASTIRFPVPTQDGIVVPDSFGSSPKEPR